MIATASPSPFPTSTGFVITIKGGTPPYEVTAYPSPPNPPGVRIHAGPPVRVTVPPGTPPGTTVTVDVQDGATPPQTVPVSNTTG
jgi:hypothetical protein